MIDLYIISKD